MKVYYPLYYNSFRCIAEKCQHSCCVGWEISVDSSTLGKYENLGREDILCHIKNGEIVLCDTERCPFLDKNGLCRIISKYGEDYISDICREHPRFYHRVADRVEGGIGLCCEEAARIILSSDSYTSFEEREWCGEIADQTDFDGVAHRDYIYSLLSDRSVPYRDRKEKIKDKYSIKESAHSADEWMEILSELEYLNDEHRGIFSIGEGVKGQEEICERFLAYLIFRHLSIAEGYENLRARLGFCLLLTSLLEGYISEGEHSVAEIFEHARIISEEIEYSEDNTASLIFEFEANLF